MTADYCRTCGRRDEDYRRPETGYWDDPWCVVCGRGPAPLVNVQAYNGRRYRQRTPPALFGADGKYRRRA